MNIDNANVISVFDGMACGMLALQEAGIKVSRYVAFEIDKYAVQTASHNFPMIEQRGDVFEADFTEFEGFDFLIGGSPCTYWSIAQKNNRETEASGMGWELFSQYVRALHEVNPMYFIYENNKSMSNAIRESITDAFGFEPICINSALVSAQNRQRLYWVGKRNADGTYSKVDIQQPEDRGILLRDVLDGAVAWREKSHCIDASCYKGGNLSSFTKQSGQRFMAAEPVNMTTDGKARTIRATCYKDGIRNMVGNDVDRKTCVAEPVCIQEQVYGRKANSDGTYDRRYEARVDKKSGTLTGTMRQNAIAEPVRVPEYGVPDKGRPVSASYARKGSSEGSLAFDCFPDNPNKQVFDYVTEPVRVGTYPNNAKNQSHDSQQYRIYSTDGKAVTQCGNGGGMGAKTGLYAISVGNMYEKQGQNGQLFSVDGKSKTLSAGTGVSGRGIGSNNAPKVCAPCDGVYAIPVEFDGERPVKAVSGADGKLYDVYEVKDGFITIKGKRYAIKLADGYYIIRKLTVSECKRLQTVPEWYEFPVSNTQAFKLLGNGWTVKIIAHLLQGIVNENTSDKKEN